jgi:DnaK suppressor protein
MKENKKEIVVKKLPAKLVAQIKEFLESKLLKLKRTEKSIKKADPFTDSQRTSENSLEDDLDEQIGHFDTEIKVNFLKKQGIQLRKALTRIKIGKYGICEKCGKMIDTDRLAISPEVTTCVKCEKEKEF